MADNFNLINFKRGTLADLQALNTAANRSKIEIGTFYLTIDEGSNAPESTRLFIGREVPNPEGSGNIKKVVPVNQGIVRVDNVDALNNNTVVGNFQAGDFAYVSTGNIFAVYDGAAWKQINSVGTDTYINDVVTDVTVTDNVATVAQTGRYNTQRADIEFNGFKIAGDGGITMSATAGATNSTPDVLTITGDEYSLSHGSAANNSVDIELSSVQENDSSITLKGGTNVTLTTPASGDDAGKIVISAADVYADDLTFSNESQGFLLTAGRNNQTEFSSNTFDPQITVGVDNAKKQTVHFANGIAALDVYTKAEIDEQQKTLNAMVYKGTIGNEPRGTAATSVSAITNVHIGDTFKIVDSNLTLTAAQSGDGVAHSLKVGDMLIAKGTEDPTTGLITSGLTYDLIPAGDETDTTYTLEGITHGVNLDPSTVGASSAGSFALAEGTQISLTDSTGDNPEDKVVTVAHATITKQTNDTDTEVNQTQGRGLQIPVISDITLDNGHVTKWTIKQYNVVDTSISLDSLGYTVSTPAANASGYKKEATIESAIGWSGQDGVQGTDVTGSFKLMSDNLVVTTPTPATAGVPEVKMNLVWGTIPTSA